MWFFITLNEFISYKPFENDNETIKLNIHNNRVLNFLRTNS